MEKNKFSRQRMVKAMNFEIKEASSAQLTLVRELFLEYATSLDFDLSFQGFKSELTALPKGYRFILLAFRNSDPAGCIALREIDRNICEMKRLFVRKEFQGQGIGRALTESILAKAIESGYQKIRLDTVPSMTAAIGMYESMGFYSIPAYRENPIAGATYLEKLL